MECLLHDMESKDDAIKHLQRDYDVADGIEKISDFLVNQAETYV